MRFVLALVVSLFCLAPAHSQTVRGFAWEHSTDNPDFWGLRYDGVQVGVWNETTGVYQPLLNSATSTFGEACPLPVPAPAEAKQDWRTAGVTPGESKPGLRFGGGDEETLEEIGAPKAPPNIPPYEKLPSFTVVSRDAKLGERILRDLNTSPSLAEARKTYGTRAKAYTPDNFALRPFKLSQDTRFKLSGVVILLQGPPDEVDKAPVRKVYGYSGPESLASEIRTIDPAYDPNDTASSPGSWSKLHVGVGVGAGVAAIFSLILGGLLKWRLLPS